MLQSGTKAIVQFKEGGSIYWSREMDSLNGTIVTLTFSEPFSSRSVAWRCEEHTWVFDPLWLTSVQVDSHGLLLANIRLRSGRIAPRWVRQDNPNIVSFVPAEPKPVPVGLDETPVTVHVPLYGCCGGSWQFKLPAWLIHRNETGPLPDVLKGFKDWAISFQKQRIEGLQKTLRNPHHSSSTRSYYEADLKNAQNYKKELEELTQVNRKLLRDKFGITLSKNTGILIGLHDLGPDSKQFHGIWAKLEQEAPDEPVEEFPVPEVMNRKKVEWDRSNVFQTMVLEDGSSVHWAYGCSGTGTANLMYTEIANNGDVKPGDLFMFILNKGQMTKTKSSQLAQAGFERILVAGNRNHPETSMLYLYGRKVTEGDKA